MDSNAIVSANCLPAGTQVGEYRVLDVIGEGGFGVVYRALDLALDREIALKEYMPSTLAGRHASFQVHVRSQHRGAFDAGLRSFINEARLLARFAHPALVHVYRFFEANGTAYMVMHYYKGQTLGTALRDQEIRVDQVWTSAMLTPLLDVLEVLHSADCYHRDIAPDNIFLQQDGNPVLLDFGAARRIIGDMTQALTMVLKPGFAPIEQYVDDGAMPQGAWTDIYQIGALLYLMVTGRTPPTSVARMINDPLKPLTPAEAPGFSSEFLQAIHRALAVRPADRPQSIPDLRALLGLQIPVSVTLQGRLPMALPSASMATPAAVAMPQEPTAPPSQPVAEPVATVAAPAQPAQPEPSPATPPVGPAKQGRNTEASPPAPAPQVQRPKPPEASAAAKKPRPAERSPAPAKKGNARLVAAAAAGLVAVVLVVGVVWWRGHSEETAQAQLAAQKDSLAWEQARAQSTITSVQDYLVNFPEGTHREAAQSLLVQLSQDALQAAQQAASAAEAAAAASAMPPASVAVASPAAAPASGPATTPAVAPVAGVPAPPARPATPEAMGKILFRIVPWGYVSVNKAPAKASPPLTQLELPEGVHQVDITNPGVTEPVTQTIFVRRGQTSIVSHKFE